VAALVGALGAGKTVFAKGVAEGLGLDATALASPTFVIANELPLPMGGPVERLLHADFYRVEHLEELEACGLHDWLAPHTLVLVEWGDRFPDALPRDRLEVRLDLLGAEARRIEAKAGGDLSASLLERWEAQVRRRHGG